MCVCVFLLSDLSRSLFLLAFTTEKKMAARYVRWNVRGEARPRGKERVERVVVRSIIGTRLERRGTMENLTKG